ncbi:dienelactone hydrolase [Leucobacter luti]|uniref:Dienelactone hydrolase n=1 Tax=Leucobacter luti TaxID=340320 RepID=A0A4R6S1L0_9MICO|nr:dienelactone hydrolase family protein [Leucobacter luti]TDP93400.1 dienelactone hydrolase [Leucobacter luti]
MIELVTRDIAYRHGGTEMLGLLVAPTGATGLPSVLLVHDAFGLGTETQSIASRLAALGLTVFAADVWAGRQLPASPAEIGPLIGSMVADRAQWHGRVAAAHAAAITQPEVDPRAVVGLGHCFGGSSVLELLRTGALLDASASSGAGAASVTLRGVVAIHAGLDLLAEDWDTAAAAGAAKKADAGWLAPRVLICSGADDPMATPEQRRVVQAGLDRAGIDWELDLYSGTVHAFTSPNAAHSPEPEVFNYHPANAGRAWSATLRFLREIFPEMSGTASP